MEILLILVLCCTVIFFVFWGKSKSKCNVPGPMVLPFVGTIKETVLLGTKGRLAVIKKLRERYGDLFKLKIGPFYFVFICGYKLIHEYFQNSKSIFLDRPNFLPSARGLCNPSYGHLGLVWNNGVKWKALRRFTLKALTSMNFGKTSTEKHIMDEVNAVLAQLEDSKGRPMCVKDCLFSATVNTIHSVIFGFRYEIGDEKLNELMSHFNIALENSSLASPDTLFPCLRFLFRKKYATLLRHDTEMANYINEQIELHRQSFHENEIRDFTDLYILSETRDNIESVHKNDFLNTIFGLFLAGLESTAFTLQWALLYAIAYPEVQRRCQIEIDNEVGDRSVLLSDYMKLKYTMATLLEVQRLVNVAGSTLPRTPSGDTEVNGYCIPKGAVVFGVFSTIHMDEKYFEKPEVFNPGRFIDDSGELTNTENLTPFSLGPRVCAGATLAKSEMFLVFANVLQKFSLDKTEEELKMEGIAKLLVSPHPFKLKANLRH